MNWQTCLTHAAALIDKCGWIADQQGNPVDGFCTIGAIGLASRGNDALLNEACDAVVRALVRRTKMGFQGDSKNAVAAWNDSVAISKEQVVGMLREAAQETTALKSARVLPPETVIYQLPELAFVEDAMVRQMQQTMAEMLKAGPLASKRKVASTKPRRKGIAADLDLVSV